MNLLTRKGSIVPISECIYLKDVEVLPKYEPNMTFRKMKTLWNEFQFGPSNILNKLARIFILQLRLGQFLLPLYSSSRWQQ